MEEEPQIQHVFVYGTLKKDYFEPQYEIDIRDIIRFEGEGTIKGSMYTTGSYPFVILGGEEQVKGFLYFCFDIKKVLDKYDAVEGLGNLFQREVVDVQMEDGSIVKSYIYTALEGLKERYMNPNNRIQSGEWND